MAAVRRDESGLLGGGWTKGQGVVALAAALTAVSLVESAYAGKNVQVDRIARGAAKFEQNGSILTIRAADRTIINYRQFNVAGGETVRFIQPSATSRVLNRITSSVPSKIDGTVTANGVVYFVNPSGILFGKGAVVNVGHLYAAAGTITDANFLANIDQFKTTGAVVNQGAINGDAVALIGRTVANAGTIAAEGGLVTMVAGDDVMIGTRDGHIMVKVGNAADNAATASAGSAPKGSVTNTGTVRTGTMALAGGDMYAMAIGGSIKAKNVSAQTGGNVVVTGKIDASDSTAGAKGGNVVITGKNVALQGATIDASGDVGGGNVLVGGDFQGKGETPRATNTAVDNGTTITASATGNGDGGNVVVWSDNKTTYNGSIYAKGGAAGGDGGRVEVSGKGHLDFNGQVDTTAPMGNVGSLLLDPHDLTIVNSGPDVHGDGSNQDVTGDIAAGDDGANDSFITSGQLVTLLNTTDVSLAATHDINVNDTVDAHNNAGSHALTLDAGHDLNVNQPIELNNATLTLNGGNRVNISNTINTHGGDLFVTSSGGDVVNPFGGITANHMTIEAATGIGTSSQRVNVQLAGGLEAHAASGDIQVQAFGDTDLGFAGGTKGGVIADNGNVTVLDSGTLSVRTAGHVVSASGDVWLQTTGATDNIVTDNFDGVGAGQVRAGGSVALWAGGGVTIGATSAGDVHAAGGFGVWIAAFNGSVTIDNGSFVETDAGDVNVSAATTVALAQTLAPGAHLWNNGTGAFTIDAPAFTSASGAVPAAVRGGGQVIIKADTVDFTDDIESTSSAIGSWVAFRTHTAGRGISLADGPVAGQLTITGAQLAHVKAPYGVIIGDTNDGDISIAGTINQPATGWNLLRLVTAGSISDAAGGTLQVDTLWLNSQTGVTLDNQSHFIGAITYAGNVTSGGIAIKNAGDLTIENVVATGQDVSITTGGQLFQVPGGGVTARNLTLEAANGIGTSPNWLGVNLTGGLEAHATTGSIFISSGHALDLGFAGGTKGGVAADAGDVIVAALGDIYVRTADHPVVASGNVAITAFGGTVATDNFSGSGAGQVVAGGAISLTGDTDVTIGQTTYGDVHAGGALTLHAGSGTVTIDNGSFVETDGGDVTVIAGTAVNLAQTSAAGAHLWSGGTGSNALTITAPSFSSASGAVPAAVKSAGGIIIQADTVDFTDDIESTSSAVGNWVAFRTLTPGRGISLADGPVAGQLTLTGTQLSHVKAGYAVMIGDLTDGDISVAGTINQPASGWTKLCLVTGGSISDAAGGTIQADELATYSLSGTTLNNQTHFVGTFEANNFTSGGIAFKNSGDLTIGTLGPVAGVHAATAGGVDIQTTGVLSVTGSGASETVTAVGDVHLSGLDVVTGGGNATTAVKSDTGSVTLAATRDVLIGSGDFGDVHAATGLTITAGRDVKIDNGSFVETDGGNVSVTGDASVQFLQTTASGSHLWNNGTGTLTISTPSLTANSGGTPATIKTGGNVGADIVLNVDTISLSDAIDAGSATITIAPLTAGRAISLADSAVAGQLTLTSTDLSQMTASTIIVGNASAGDISVAGTINQPASGWNVLHLITGGSVSDAAGGTLQVDELDIDSVAGITLDNQAHFIGTFSAANTGSGGITLKTAGDLVLGDVNAHGPGNNGSIESGGQITVLPSTTVSVNNLTLEAATGIGTSSAPLSGSVNGLEAHTTTGGIFFTNATGMNLGFAGGTKGGVVADSGDVSVTANGIITVGTAGHVVSAASGDVTLESLNSNVVIDNYTGPAGGGQVNASGAVSITANNSVTIGATTAGDVHAGTGLTITATNGSVTIDHGSNVATGAGDVMISAGADVVGPSGTITTRNLTIEAGAGIGTVANPLTVALTGGLEAHATAGDIVVASNRAIGLGFAGGTKGGVVADSGNVSVTSAGTISVTTAGEQVSASGDVTLVATTGDIVTDNFTGPPGDGQVAAGGAVTLTAAHDVTLGATSGIGDVHAGNGLTITATAGTVTIDNGSYVEADAGDVAVTGGTAVNLVQTTLDQSHLWNNGSGTLTITAPSFSSNSGGIPASLQSGGAITIVADTVSFTDAITSTSDAVTFRPLTAGRGISLADSGVTGQLTLTGAELSLVSGTKVIIGSASAGNISVAGTINQPASGWSTLHLITGGSVSDAAGGTLQVDDLAVEAVTGIDLSRQSHLVGNFAASNATSGGVSFTGGVSLIVGTVDGVTGITSGGNVTIATDGLDITQAINTGAGVVTLRPLTPGTAIDVGTEVGGKLSLTSTELDLVTAGALRIGSNAAGDINVSNADDTSAGWTTLHLITGGNIGETGNITAGSLALEAGGSINLLGANAVDTVAASAGTTLTVRSANDLLVDTVDGVTGVTANGLTQLTTSQSITLNKNVTAGTGHLIVLTSDTGITQTGGSVTAGSLAAYSLTSGDITLDRAGNNVGAFAADSAGAVTFRNDGAFAVDDVNGITGISAHGDVTLTIDHTGDLTVVQPIVTNGGNFHATVSAGGFSDTLTTGTIDTHGPNPGDSAGNITITASGAVTLANDLDLTGNDNAAGDGGDGGNVTISGSAVSLQSVNTSGGNSTSVGDVGGSAGDIDITGTTSITLSDDLTAGAGTGDTNGSTGNVGLHGPVVLGNDVTITAHDVTFGSSVHSTTDGAEGLTIASDSAGTVTFGGAVGDGGKKLASLTVNGQAATLLNGGSVATTGNQTYTGPVTLGADTTITSGGVVTFNKTVRGATTGVDSLTITATTGNTFLGAIGDGGKALESLAVTGPVDLNGSSVTTAAGQTYTGAVTLSHDTTLTGTTIAFTSTVDGDSGGPYDLTLHNSGLATFGGTVGAGSKIHDLVVDGPSALNGGAVLTTGLQTYSGAATLGANSTLTGTAITFGSSLDGSTAGGQTLTVANSGLATFNGAVGTTKLSSLTVNGTARLNGVSVGTTGDQHYKSAVTLAKDVTLTAANVTFDSTVGGTTNGGEGLAILNSGTVTFKDNVGTSALRLESLSIDGATTIATAGPASVFTAGAQHYKGAFSTNANLTLTGSSATFDSTVRGLTAGGQSLTIAGPATFNGAVGDAGKSFSTLSVGGTTAINGPSVTTTGAQSYADAVTVGSNATLAGSAISFASSVNGATDGGQSLTLANTGLATFTGAVGNTNRLSSLTVSGASAINGGSVRTTGAQTYTGATTLGADTTLTGTAITFGSTLDAASAGGQGLTLHNSAVATFNGAVGGTNALKFLTIDGPTSMNAGAVTTTGDQSYGGELTLVRNATLTGAHVTLVKVTGGSNDLTIAGAATFNGTVAAGNLAVTGASAVNGGSITTTGTQTYSGPATLGADTTLGGTTITFGQSVNGVTAGNQALTVNGTARFQGDVGTAASLKSLTVRGITEVGNGHQIITKGNQLYSGIVTVTGSGATFHAGSYNGTQLASPGTVTFKRDLNTSGAVVVYGATGITFNGDVVGNDPAADTLTLQVPWIHTDAPAVVNFASASGPTRVRNLSKLSIENPLGDRGVPQVATVAVTSGQGIIIEVTDAFSMQRNEKMTAAAEGASITIDVASGTASIGDLNAPGDINVHASKVELMARAPGLVLAHNSSGGPATTTDNGLDFVAGGSLNFTGTVSINADGLAAGQHNVAFAFRGSPPAAGFVSQVPGALLLLMQRPVDASLLTLNGTVLDLPPTGTSPVNPSTIRAGVTQIHVVEPGKEPGISDASKSFLADIGVHIRDLTQAELIEGLDGRDMYVQAPEPLLRVALPRLNEQLVADALNLYTTLFATEGGPTNPAEVKATVKKTLAQALDAYKVASNTTGDNVDPIAFRHFVETSPEHKQALAQINRLRSFLIQLDMLSLTQKELADARDTVCRDVAPAGLSLQAFEAAVLGKATPAR